MLIKDGEYYRTSNVDYHDGEKYPHVVRDKSKPDLISEIIRPHATVSKPSPGGPEIISAILRAQLLSMRLRTGTRRGGAVFSAITGLVFYGFWTAARLGRGFYFSPIPGNAANFVPVLSSGLLFVTLYWQVAPVISAGFGASLDLRKLLAYPIPHGKLFTVEILLRDHQLRGDADYGRGERRSACCVILCTARRRLRSFWRAL